MSTESPTGKTPVSVIVPTKNEGANIRRCLEHLQWADQVFVVDSQSTDDTVEASEELGATVVQFHYKGGFPKKRNWALENLPLRNEWVLLVDADEVVSPELRDEIARKVADPDCDGYFINFRYMFLGSWIRHCGYYPVWVLRLIRHRLGRYEQLPEPPQWRDYDCEVHEHIMLDGKTGYLENDMEHYAYPTISDWVRKHNVYSNWEAVLYDRFVSGGDEEQVQSERSIGAKQQIKRRLKKVYLRLPFRFVFRFIYAYFIRLGFLDGMRGFMFCGLLTFYDFLSWVKVYERRVTQKAEG